MDSHRRLLSTLHIIYGSLHLVGFLIFSTIIRSFFPFIFEEINQNDPDAAFIFDLVFSVIKSVFLILVILVPLPSIIGGWGFMNNKKWGINLLMISGCLSLFSIPFGTALGVYTIWTFLEYNKQERND